jgi:uncharacterized membrane protein
MQKSEYHGHCRPRYSLFFLNTVKITAFFATGRFYLFLFAAFSAITFLAHLNHLLASM